MRKFILYGIILFQIALIISLVRGIQLSRRSSSRIALMQDAKIKLEADKEKLAKEEEYVSSTYYLEKVARDELHLSKPGETIVLVPDNRQVNESVSENIKIPEIKPNWKKWWEVLIGTN